ncbi:hypothetical protein BDV96DRAFT_643098 [Lophiotrema nucula]|uniref:Inhibitor I9 domain-containing protein n=1 Tax=Lophiotrema nucula TaxID=690887 RepID=A0A6A5ZHI1_9PLEO|nr:hypothetical protein BDV96DRAFT_643098 [Lophiotrema nucula]
MATMGMAAVAPLKSVIISFPKGTPGNVVEQAIQTVKDSGGEITHVYNIIQGFSANVPDTGLEQVQTLGQAFNMVVEEDQLVQTNNGMGI